jgi:hypothetical protein
MKVGAAADGPIGAMIDMGSDLYVIHSDAIYAVRLADQIDPQRTNISVPNTHQLLVSVGGSSPDVGRVFLTAYTMFTSIHLGQDFPEKKARALAFDYLRDILAMRDQNKSLDTATQSAIEEFTQVKSEGRNVRIPALSNVQARCDAFAQKVGHAVDTLKDITHLLYPPLSKKWTQDLERTARERHGDENALTQFMIKAGPGIRFYRELRNMIEHPRDDARIDVYDFRLTPKLELLPPWVHIVQGGQDSLDGTLTSLMSQVIDELVAIAESFFASLAAANAKPFSGFGLYVMNIPEDRRPKWNPHQRLSYGINLNGTIQPLG